MLAVVNTCKGLLRMTSVQRLAVVKNHLQSGPSITVSPQTALVDERVRILIRGLRPHQMVTVVADLIENKVQFESMAVFRADPGGQVDISRQESLAGSYTGVDPMGLVWSLNSIRSSGSNTRLVKKNVTTPMRLILRLLDGHIDGKGDSLDTATCLAETYGERYYIKAGVKRIPLTTGRLRGTVFVPEGEGPFPAVVDMYGGFVSLIENRAALLASHGYAVFALTYLFVDHLPKTIPATDAEYLKEAAQWFSEQPYVDADRIGSLGLCYGGCISLFLASALPLIKAAVNINGVCFSPPEGFGPIKGIPGYVPADGRTWPVADKLYMTEEGIVIKDMCHNEIGDVIYIPAWQHGAKLMVVVGMDDKQVLPSIHEDFRNACPEEFKPNITIIHYDGAGHLIDPPYSPNCRAMLVDPRRLKGTGFIPDFDTGISMMSGGFPKEHAHAQEDSWQRILSFFSNNL